MGVVKTEIELILPVGYQDESGALHTKAKMRLATAADEILPMKDPRVQQNPAYLSIILLSRVLVDLGPLGSEEINPKVIEGLFAADLAYLQEKYNILNQNGSDSISTACPECKHSFEVESEFSGEF